MSCIHISRGYTWRQVQGAGIPFFSKSFKQHVSTKGFISLNMNPCFPMEHFHGSTMRFSFFFFNFFGHKACEILVLHPRSEPRPPALEAESYPLYSREIPHQCVLNYFILQGHWGFPDGSASKEPTRQCRGCKEMQVQSLDWEDPLEGMATHSRILAGKIPWTEEPGKLQVIGWQKVGHN